MQINHKMQRLGVLDAFIKKVNDFKKLFFEKLKWYLRLILNIYLSNEFNILY